MNQIKCQLLISNSESTSCSLGSDLVVYAYTSLMPSLCVPPGKKQSGEHAKLNFLGLF